MYHFALWFDKWLFQNCHFPGSCTWKYKFSQKLYYWYLDNFSFVYEPFYYFTDISPQSEDYTKIRKFAKHTPAGTSWKNLVHLTQQMRGEGDSMRLYDYGPEGNRLKYGQEKVKYYDFGLVRDTKISAYVGKKDFLEPPEGAIKG